VSSARPGDEVLVCCTEMTPPDAIDRYITQAWDVSRFELGSAEPAAVHA
jgi:hypothetical protein